MPVSRESGIISGKGIVYSDMIPEQKKHQIIQDVEVSFATTTTWSILAQSFYNTYFEFSYYQIEITSPTTLPLTIARKSTLFIFNLEGEVAIHTPRRSSLTLNEGQISISTLETGNYEIELKDKSTTLLFLRLNEEMERAISQFENQSFQDSSTSMLSESQYGRIQELQNSRCSGGIWKLKREVILLDLIFKTLELTGNIKSERKKIELHPDYESMQKIRYYIQANTDKKITINYLANHFGIPVRRLKHDYYKVFNQKLSNYISETKMKKARQLLQKSKMAVKEIAWEVGYETATGFSRQFKLYYNQSPSKVRQS